MDKLSDADFDRLINGGASADNASSEQKAADDTAHNQHSGKTWRDGLITARELQTKQFKPVRIILPHLIPEGVTLVAGKPKVGKSWLAYDVCLAVADETRLVLGTMKPGHGDVLYLALEDNQRRLKKRLDKILQGADAPERLHLHTEWRRMDQGGLKDLEVWIKSVEAPRLIWIDTLAKIRALPGRNEPPYAADYRAIEGVQRLAGEYGVGVVFNTHLRKMASEDDAFDEVSGTLGLTGAADTIIVMKRHSGMMKICVRGRDIEETEFAAEFNRDTCRWRLVGGAEETFRSQERQAIIAALKDAGTDKDGNPAAISLGDILTATERTDRSALKSLLHKMRKAGEVVSPRAGYHALPDKDPLSGVDRIDRTASEGGFDGQDIDNTDVSVSVAGQRSGQRPVNGSVSVDRALTEPEDANHLDGNGNPASRQRVNGVNGVANGGDHVCAQCHRDPPDGLEELFPVGRDLVWLHPECRRFYPSPPSKPDGRPAIGPPGDRLDDLQ